MSTTKTQVATPASTSKPKKSSKSDRVDKSSKSKGKSKNKKSKTKEKEAVVRRSRINPNQGIYINPSRCKYWMDTHGLNSDIENAIEALRLAEPHDIKNKEGVVTKTTKKVPIDELPKDVQQLIELARVEWEDRETERVKKDKKDAERAKNSAEAAEKMRIREERLQKANAERQAKIDAQIAQGTAPAAKKVTPYAREIELLSKMRIRFSKDSSLRTAATICLAVHELMSYGMEKVLKADRRIVKQSHILEPGYENLPLSCLYTKLDVFKNALEEERGKAVKAREAKERKDKEKQVAKAAEKEAGTAEKDVEVKVESKDDKNDKDDKEDDKDDPSDDEADAEAEDDDEVDDDDDDDPEDVDSSVETVSGDNGLDFKHYIRQVCFNIIAQKKEQGATGYDSIRISQEIKDFGSNLVIAFIKDLCPLLHGQISIMNVRTISPQVVKHVIDMHLQIDHVDSKDINEQIDEKIQKYIEFAADRKKKNAAKKKVDEQSAKDVAEIEDKVAELKVVEQPKSSRRTRATAS
jgi:hypothetical protein